MKTSNPSKIGLALGLGCVLWSCHLTEGDELGAFPADTPPKLPREVQLGKQFKTHQANLYEFSDIDTLEVNLSDATQFEFALKQQLAYWDTKRSDYQFSVPNYFTSDKNKMSATLEALKHYQAAAFAPPSIYFEAYRLKGVDNYGNIKFTGYYSPIIPVSASQDTLYKYAIYAMPEDMERFSSRREIELEGKLKDKGLEIAYAKSWTDILTLQMQGSGYLEFPNGRKILISYAGTNNKPNRSVSKYVKKNYGHLVASNSYESIDRFIEHFPDKWKELLDANPSYVFFQVNGDRKAINGAAGVPLTAQYSIAVDRRFIPLGACLLGAVPILKRKQKQRVVTHHEYRWLFAQDIGGRIRGSGHIDLYTGIGSNAKKNAALHHYGNLYVLLAKD